MKKLLLFLVCVLSVQGCSKHDPVLPGVRYDIFESFDVAVENADVPDLNVEKNISGDVVCDYRQDSSNTIWSGENKIFSGFAMENSVKSNQSPICDGGFIYTGLSTGEVIKLNPRTKRVVWVADVFRSSNLTGGASVVDIVAHVGIDKRFVYAGGLGDSFCKLNKSNGDKVWCVNISVPTDFIIVDNFAFVVGTDSILYAINIDSGKIYWKSEIKKQVKPEFENGVLIVGREKINPKDGSLME